MDPTAAETDEEETGGISALPTPVVNGDQETALRGLRQKRNELEPIGKTLTLDVPGYEGKLGIKYKYIGSEETELISKKVMKETKKHGHRGMALLSAADTLIAACDQVLIRSDSSKDWKPLEPAPIRFERQLAEHLEFSATEPRGVVLGVFGSEHAAIEQYMRLSSWLTDVTREVDDDFFGL